MFDLSLMLTFFWHNIFTCLIFYIIIGAVYGLFYWIYGLFRLRKAVLAITDADIVAYKNGRFRNDASIEEVKLKMRVNLAQKYISDTSKYPPKIKDNIGHILGHSIFWPFFLPIFLIGDVAKSIWKFFLNKMSFVYDMFSQMILPK
jgi:hypothetical protein